MSWFWTSFSARVVFKIATSLYEMLRPNMLSQRIISFEPGNHFVYIDNKEYFNVRSFVFFTSCIKSWSSDVRIFYLRFDNCWFVRGERICFKKISVRCGKVVLLWSNYVAVGGQFVYMLRVFRISPLISFAANLLNLTDLVM